MAEEVANIAGTKIMPLSQLLMQDTPLQMSLIILVIGIVAIILVNRKISFLIDTKKFVYARPDAAEFAKKIMLSMFATVLVVSVSGYIQVFELFDSQVLVDAANANEDLTPRETFAKILNTFVILVIGNTVAQIIPIILSNRETKKMEKHDYGEWIHMRGFSNDKQNLFHLLFEWIPPIHANEEAPTIAIVEVIGWPPLDGIFLRQHA